MINNIIAFSIKNKLIVAIVILGLIGYGSYELTRLPIDAVPDITENQVQVITVAPSFGATDIERLVTFPVEQANSNIAGLKTIRSFSRFGLSLVTLVFQDGIDIYWARQQVAERLIQLQSIIPRDIGIPELGPISTGLGEIYQYVVRPKQGYEKRYDVTQLRTIQDWIVRRQLLGVEGVAEVSSFGGKVKQYAIEVNPERLAAMGYTIRNVLTALERNNQNTGGAYIERGPTVLYIRSEGLIAQKEDLQWIQIFDDAGKNPVALRDLAEIRESYATRYGALCYNDAGEVAGAIVMMLKGANSNEVIQHIKRKIEQIQKSLPEGVVIEPFLDRTKMVANAIHTVRNNLLEGALIVLFVLVLFLGHLRAGLLVASVIPLSMLFAVILMNFFGVSGNLMSLGALDFGLIVDGAVIIVEGVLHRLAHHKKMNQMLHLSQNKVDDEVRKTSQKMMNSAIFGQVIILVVYLPIFSLQGIEGKMFKPMAQTVAFALLGAFILSLTYVPMMSAWLLHSKKAFQLNFSDRWMERIQSLYRKSFNRLIKFSKPIFAGVLILFILSIVILSRLGGEFIPALEEGDFAVDTRVLTGSNLQTTVDATQKCARILLKRFPEVEKVVTKIGSGEVPTDPMPMEASDMMVILKDKSSWKSARTFDEMAAKMGEALQDIPGVTAGFQYPVQMRFNELMTGSRQDVVCKIFGENLDTLAKYADLLGDVAKRIRGVKDVYVEPVSGLPQITIRYNRLALAQYGVDIETVNQLINTSFAGQSAGQVFEDEKRFDLVVRLASEMRKNLDDIRHLPVSTSQGGQIPLALLADVAIEDGPNQVQREDAKRRIVVGFNVRARDVESVVEEMKMKSESKLKMPAGYFTTYGGSFENLNAAKNRLLIAVPVSLLLIFLLLYFAFKSIRMAVLIYSAIPLSAIGGILFLAMRGMPFSISAGVGFIALFGVAVLNGIVLVAEFNRLRTECPEKSLTELVLEGTCTRLRPVLMTAFVASLGFLPMALSHGAGAEVQRPLATVVIGGLLVATFLTLFVLPFLYLLVESGFRWRWRKSKANLLLVLFMVPLFVHAQKTITLDQAIFMARGQNPEMLLRNSENELLLQRVNQVDKALPTSLISELGQFNGPAFDVKYGIIQTFRPAEVYRAQRDFRREEWKRGLDENRWRQLDMERLVTIEFYTWLYFDAREKLLLHQDSMYAEFLRKSELRFQKGAANQMELSNARYARSKMKMQLRELILQKTNGYKRLQFLLNTTDTLQPISPSLEFKGLDAMALEKHPYWTWFEKEQNLITARTRIEKNSVKPEINAGYVWQTMRGISPDASPFSGLSYAQIAVNIPLIGHQVKNRIYGLQLESRMLEQKKSFQFKKASLYLTEWQRKLKWSDEKLWYYRNEANPEGRTMKQLAETQFLNGSIDYLQWMLIMNQVLEMEHAYLEAIHENNLIRIELAFPQIESIKTSYE